VREGRVFISYAAEDRAAAQLVCASLEAAGISCWIAPRDVAAGQRYAVAILEALQKSDVLLVFFSQHADASTHVCNEIEHATSSGKPILLVRADATDPHDNSQISLFLGSYQWLDASRGNLVEYLSEIVTDIGDLLESAETVAPHPTAAVVSKPATGSTDASESQLSIGIEIGATKLRGCLIDLEHVDPDTPLIAEYYEPVNEPASVRTILEQTKALVERMLDEHCSAHRPAGIGVAVPGQVDLRSGNLKFGPNLFRARNVPFKTYLSGSFPGIPIRIDNEVRCATRCELHLGIGKEFDSFVCMFLGTGVGSGIAIDRAVHFGHNFCAGEAGHIKIATTGPPCVCGQIGCLETFVKAQAIVERAEAKATDWESREMATQLSGRDTPLNPLSIAEAIESGDAAAQEVAAEVADNLGLGIANYLNLVNPAAVVLGGGLMKGFFFPMINEITNAVQRNALAEVANTPIMQSPHADDASVIGAALLFHPDDKWPF
jgi:glucokinase